MEHLTQHRSEQWVLVGGALVSLLWDPQRATENIDVLPLDPGNPAQLALMESAQALGMEIEAVNSSAIWFLSQVEGWQDQLKLLLQGERGRILRPNVDLFLRSPVRIVLPTKGFEAPDRQGSEPMVWQRHFEVSQRCLAGWIGRRLGKTIWTGLLGLNSMRMNERDLLDCQLALAHEGDRCTPGAIALRLQDLIEEAPQAPVSERRRTLLSQLRTLP